MKIKSLLLTTTLAAMIASPVVAAQPYSRSHEIPLIQEDVAEPQSTGYIDFLTGGIGEDERAEIESKKEFYNVHILHANVHGAYVEDTRTVISRKNGKEWEEVLNVNAGPLLYVELPQGTYNVESTRYGIAKTQKVTIGKNGKGRDVNFAWKPPVVTE